MLSADFDVELVRSEMPYAVYERHYVGELRVLFVLDALEHRHVESRSRKIQTPQVFADLYVVDVNFFAAKDCVERRRRLFRQPERFGKVVASSARNKAQAAFFGVHAVQHFVKGSVAAYGDYGAALKACGELFCVSFGFGFGYFVLYAFCVEIGFYDGFRLFAASAAAAGIGYYEIHEISSLCGRDICAKNVLTCRIKYIISPIKYQEKTKKNIALCRASVKFGSKCLPSKAV